MFGMLRYDGSENIEFVASQKKKPGNDSSGRGRLDFACKACREKKVRCTAQRSGCDRCKANNIACIYSHRQTSTNSVSKRTANTPRPKPSKPVNDAGHEERNASRSDSNASGAAPSTTSPAPHQRNTSSEFTTELPESPNFDDLSFQILQDYTTADDGFDGMLDLSHDILPQVTSNNGSDYSDMDMTFDNDCDSQLDKDLSADSMSLLMTPPDTSTSSDSLFQSHSTFETLSTLTCGPPTPPATVSSVLSKKYPASSNSIDGCSCLQMLATILERLILMKSSSALQQQGRSLDLELAIHKAAITRCETVLRCSCYNTRSEHVMMLIIVCERIVEMCDRLIGRYRLQLEQHKGSLSTNRQRAQSQSLSHMTVGDRTLPQSVSSSSCTSLSSLTHSSTTSMAPLAIGSFHISSMNEWAAVMRAVIMLQLQSTKDLVERMGILISSVTGDNRKKLHQDLLGKLKGRLTTMLRIL